MLRELWDYFDWYFDSSVSGQQVLGFLVFGSFLHFEVRGIEVFAWAFRRWAYVSESIVAPKTLERKSEPELSLPAMCFISVENSLSKVFHLCAIEIELVGLKASFLLSV